MKKYFNKILIGLLIVVVVALGAYPAYMTLIVRTALIDYGTLAVTGAATFASTISPSGNFYPSTVGTLTNGTSTLYWKGAYAAEYFTEGTNKFLDSLGVYTAFGNILSNTVGTLDVGTSSKYFRSGYFATLFIKGTNVIDSSQNMTLTGKLINTGDSARIQGNLKVNGLLKGGAIVARIDSFTTTALKDTVVMTGARAGDAILITPFLPLYSTTPDTGVCPYNGFVLANDSVVVQREYFSAGRTAKSGAQYFVHLISKQ